MAAYAALISLMHIIDDIETHPNPPISLNKKQVESLTKIVTFVQEFLEGYKSPYAYSNEADPLEIRIMDAAHAAEDVIESYTIDTIQLSAAATDDDGGDEQTRCIHFYQDLQNVIEEMDLIKKEVTETAREKKEMVSDDAGLRSSSSSTEKNPIMVGFDGVLLQLLDRLTDGNTNRQIIPIVGMGGIGKTTLAKGAFEHKLIQEHFDVRVWATISQDYDIVETLRQVLSQVRVGMSNESEHDLGEKLHKSLAGRRYLVIMDDLWSVEVWDKMKFFFPEHNNGSRIIVTTRMSNFGAHLKNSNTLFEMRFLDKVSSWTLFSQIVFGGRGFPTQLESIGKKIVEKCNGLPLAIVVTGGLISRSEVSLKYWESVEKNFCSIVNSENDDYCSRILKLSYNQLPVYLKPCFLYMGVFEEDRVIKASTIVELWVSEGFLKPVENKSSTTIAKEYLNELVDRNLIIVHELGLLGNVKSCKIHDLLRDLSMKEAQKQRFFYVLRDQSPRGVISQHRIVIPGSTSKEKISNALKSMSHARSYVRHRHGVQELPDSRFLRTLFSYDSKYTGFDNLYSLEKVFHLVNSRCLAFKAKWESVIPSINLLWNLRTLIICCVRDFIAPIEIWNMHKLRLVEFTNRNLYLSDPLSISGDFTVMENLEALKGMDDFSLSEDVVKRIPNIKKMDVNYSVELLERVSCLSYLQCLSKLESLRLLIYSSEDRNCLLKMSFPPSLKKLTLSLRSSFELEDIMPMIGSLPLLQKLALYDGRFRTREWETAEGQFLSLKSLTLWECRDLEKWTVLESSHFPLLQELHLLYLEELEDIPLEIGEIAKLRSIKLHSCSESAVLSAKRILEEQEDLHGDEPDLHVSVTVRRKDKDLMMLASSNFKVSVFGE